MSAARGLGALAVPEPPMPLADRKSNPWRRLGTVPSPVALERWNLGLALAAGICLRWMSLSLLAIEHHDEAVYASNLLFDSAAGGEFPGRPLYAPPLLPMLLEWTQIFGQLLGMSQVPWWPMLPGLLAGTLLIPSVWWIARQWFSPAAGLAAAWLVALSEYHAFYSRTALTDPLVLLWLLWAVYAGWQALQHGQPRWILIAGLLTAAAWWTKYTGWLPIAIVAAGGLLANVWSPNSERNWTRWLRVSVGMAVVAGVLWIPVWWDCQSVGGYSAVAANHRGYLLGPGSWGVNWIEQNAKLSHYVGPTTWLSGVCGLWAGAMGVLVAGRALTGFSHGLRSRGGVAGALIGAAILLGLGWPLAAGTALALLAPVMMIVGTRKLPVSAGERLAGSLLLAWFGGLWLTTPLYYPYPRLVLPLWLATVLLMAWGVHRWLLMLSAVATPASPRSIDSSVFSKGQAAAATPLFGLLIAGGVCGVALATSRAVEDRRSALTTAVAIVQAADSPRESVFLVYSDPALFYQLAGQQVLTAPRGDWPQQAIPSVAHTYVLTGANVTGLADDAMKRPPELKIYQQQREWLQAPSTLVRLDGSTQESHTQEPGTTAPAVVHQYRLSEAAE